RPASLDPTIGLLLHLDRTDVVRLAGLQLDRLAVLVAADPPGTFVPGDQLRLAGRGQLDLEVAVLVGDRVVGVSDTRSQPVIHGWMLHDNETGIESALRLFTSCFLPGATITLPPGFLSRLPCQLMLWATGAVLSTSRVCPSRMAMTCGSKAQRGWSMWTVF